MRAPRTALAALLALAAAGTAAAQAPASAFKPKKSKIADEEVDKAIEKGVAWLKANGGPCEELVAYTLYHGGVPKNDPTFQSYLKRIVDKDPAKTYNTSIAAMFLSELDRTGYQWRLEHFAQFLVDNQCENGQWTYGEPIRIEKKPELKLVGTEGAAPAPAPQVIGTGTSQDISNQVLKAPPPKKDEKKVEAPLYGTQILPTPPAAKGAGRTQTMNRPALPPVLVKQRRRNGPAGDNSNSQYASLGLRACGEAGILIDEKCLRDALRWWEEQQCGDGGWGYGPKDAPGSWGSMTVGAVGAISIYKWLLGKPWQGDSRIKRGMDWLNDKWAVDKNPRAQEVMPDRAKFHYYYLYGLERAGMIYGTDFFGAHDWYDEGARWLIDHQNPDGSWTGAEENTSWRTCFAILFLRRATKPLPKDPPQKIFTGGGR